MATVVLSIYVACLPVVIATVQTAMDWITETHWQTILQDNDDDDCDAQDTTARRRHQVPIEEKAWSKNDSFKLPRIVLPMDNLLMRHMPPPNMIA
ncbi:hypothetical protein LEN26_014454 [Aphanomyces euteiches]|uniref:Secreted protein n=1 Tax=Aphanomyces euteiches TaxID=100861 RepID=A0A6G0X745_9STRA|nr:hypothetical protein Ae201684_007725 [Aphanomyces euteiches]KAH9067443.1 hypothetical protein Ae201684P_021600 [Aphanomyces euteiches]KAH9106792.1 hypothetical protein LEN26_014454 [Aphanomyces euteiches]KAH9124833.1 hypothetical protein AeMF1_004466 [Aphanomyces euteiches]KAH9142924.1 hypothetical protein AeRB84_013044 [Aphanomyces euteiches]